MLIALLQSFRTDHCYTVPLGASIEVPSDTPFESLVGVTVTRINFTSVLVFFVPVTLPMSTATLLSFRFQWRKNKTRIIKRIRSANNTKQTVIAELPQHSAVLAARSIRKSHFRSGKSGSDGSGPNLGRGLGQNWGIFEWFSMTLKLAHVLLTSIPLT